MKNRSLNSQQDRAAAEVRRATPLKPGSAEARQALYGFFYNIDTGELIEVVRDIPA